MLYLKRYILLVIKFILVISVGTIISTFYALNNEKKIESLYDKVEDLRIQNLKLNEWYITFSGNYADLTNFIQQAEILYDLENNDKKIFNKCARLTAVAAATTTLGNFFNTYENLLSEKYLIKYKIKDKKEIYTKYYNSKLKPAKDCSNKSNQLKNIYIQNHAKILNNYQSNLLNLILDLRSDLFSSEKNAYEEINYLSSLSSNIYFYSFLIQIFLAIMIVGLDLFTNRGTNEK